MTTTVFFNGHSQAVCIPEELRFEGTEVRIRRWGDGVILEPIKGSEWPPDFFKSIRISDPAFGRMDQGELPDIPRLEE